MPSNRTLQTLSKLACMLPLSCLVALAPAQSTPYSVVAQWPLPSGGGWDYLHVDSDKHVLYITHGVRVQVVDTNTGKLVGEITGFMRAHDIALDKDCKYGFISDGDANSVTVFDRNTYAKVKTITVKIDPDSLVFEPLTKTVWAFNGRSNDVTVIDAATQNAVATIKLPGKPEYAQGDGEGNVFVNIKSRNSIVRLDATTRKQNAEWPMAGCESPSGLTIDTAHRRLFAVCDRRVMAAVNAESGKVLKLVPIGDGPDAARYDAKNQIVFSSNEDGTLTVVSTQNDAFDVIQTLKTQKSGRTMAFDPSTGKVYVLVARLGPPPPATALTPHPRPTGQEGTFKVLVISRK